ncbi:MAG: CTP synthase, partial [Thermoprotei archaeon]
FVAFVRKYLGLKDANSTEVNPRTPFPVVDLLPEQKKMKLKGGTMRLGSHLIRVVKGTHLFRAYRKEIIYERFRHRYHIMPDYAEKTRRHGLVISAFDSTGRIINAIEVSNRKWMVGVQFHPEFKSRPGKPSPIYRDFILASYSNSKKYNRRT